MKYALGNMLNGAGGLNPNGLSLDLQFAADKTLTARKGPTPVFTRGSTGTFVGSDGLIQSAAINGPRFDHDPVTLACKGLLIEEQRVNAGLQSNSFSTSPWAENSGTVTLSQNQIGPDGVANSAWTFTDDNTGSAEGRYQPPSLVSGTAYTISVYVKKTSGTPSSYPALTFARGGTGSGGAVLNTTTGVATAITSYVGTIISSVIAVSNAGDYWRVSATFTPTATGAWNLAVLPAFNTSGNGVLDGTATGSAVFYGYQLEAGAFPTSYIPTTTASLARSADVCSITGANFSGFWNRFAGTCVIGVGSSLGNEPRFVSNLVAARALEILGSANIDFFEASGSQQVRIFSSATYPVRLGLAYAINDYQGAYNGILSGVDTNTGGTIPDATALHIGNLGGTSNRLTGHIQSIRYFKKRLANAKLQSLTA